MRASTRRAAARLSGTKLASSSSRMRDGSQRPSEGPCSTKRKSVGGTPGPAATRRCAINAATLLAASAPDAELGAT
ncbi:MAG: hypothetical protein H6723_06785 [Sandaracinus sp.]|nr:hypothetical protein [Sandaracinus sp.]